MIRRLELDELDRDGRVVDLSGAQVQALQATRLVDVTLEPRGRWRLLPNGRVGAIAVDGLEVVVRPKAAISSLLFMLGYAADPGFRPSEIAGLATDDLWGAIAETLARLGERAVAAGVLQGYVTRGRRAAADPRPVAGGRPDRASSGDAAASRGALRRVLARHRREPDPAHRGAPAAAAAARPRRGARRAARPPRRPAGRGARARPGGTAADWTPSRLNGRYHAALRLAETVLAWRAPQIDAGATPLASFVVDMAKVFEDFVTVALREALAGHPGQTRASTRRGWTTEASSR